MKNRLKSLSIIELLIVMVLTTLVIYGAYFSLSSSKSYYTSRVKVLSQALDVLEWDTQVLKRIREADNLEAKGDFLLIEMPNQVHKLLIDENQVVFDNDTIAGKVIFKSFYKQNEPVLSENLVDRVAFDLIIGSDTVPFTYEKQYSASQKLQFETWQE